MKVPNLLRTRSAWALLVATLLLGCSGATPEAMLASGKDYLARNDRPAAVIQLKNALQKNPDLVEARYLLGKTLLEMGDVQAAEKELRKASDLKYPPDEVIPALARAMLLIGEPKKVITEFGKTELTSADATAGLQTTLGQSHLALGNRDGASSAFAAALSAKSGHPGALLGQARLKARTREQLPEALAIVETALASAPKHIEALQFKGEILLAQGQPDPALAEYRKVVEVKPDALPAHSMIVGVLAQQGKLEEALKQLETMKQLAPKNAQTLYLQALLAYRQGQFPAAREAIQRQLQMAPDNLPGLLLAGMIEFELKSYAQAETNLRKVLHRFPDQHLARRVLIATHLRSGEADKALEILKPLLGRIDKDSDMLATAGDVYIQNGDVAEAARYFEAAAALEPKNPRKRTAVALSHIATGDLQRAFRELEEASAADAATRADLVLIALRLQRREFDKALAAIEILEKKQPDEPLTHNLRAGALLGKGDAAGARQSLERSLTLNPTYYPAIVNLSKIDLAEKKPDDAKRRFEALLTKDPKSVQAMLALAELRAIEGAPPEEVANLIRKAVGVNVTDTTPRLALITHYLRNKDTQNAMTAVRDALATVPNRPELLDAMGRVQAAAGEADQALATYTRLAQLERNSPLPFMRMAGIHAAAKNTEEALRNLRKALAIKPDLVDAQRAIIGLDLNAGRMQQALATAREIQKQRPKQAIGYGFEGDIHASKKAWKEAAVAYRTGLQRTKGTELAPKYFMALNAAGNKSEAERFAATWTKDHPTDAVFQALLGERATIRKDYTAAAKYYRAALDSQPNNAIVLNNLAWVAGQLKDPMALEYAEKANRLAANQPRIMDTLGVLLVEAGDASRGLDLLQKASALAPQEQTIRLNLAKALLKGGQKDAAKKELDVLVGLGEGFPAHAEVAQLLKTF